MNELINLLIIDFWDVKTCCLVENYQHFEEDTTLVFSVEVTEVSFGE